MHDYCPPQFLEWGYRKGLLLQELAGFGADILCLQEVRWPPLAAPLPGARRIATAARNITHSTAASASPSVKVQVEQPFFEGELQGLMAQRGYESLYQPRRCEAAHAGAARACQQQRCRLPHFMAVQALRCPPHAMTSHFSPHAQPVRPAGGARHCRGRCPAVQHAAPGAAGQQGGWAEGARQGGGVLQPVCLLPFLLAGQPGPASPIPPSPGPHTAQAIRLGDCVEPGLHGAFWSAVRQRDDWVVCALLRDRQTRRHLLSACTHFFWVSLHHLLLLLLCCPSHPARCHSPPNLLLAWAAAGPASPRHQGGAGAPGVPRHPGFPAPAAAAGGPDAAAPGGQRARGPRRRLQQLVGQELQRPV